MERTWWAIKDLNLGPLACEASALTTELIAHEPDFNIGGLHASHEAFSVKVEPAPDVCNRSDQDFQPMTTATANQIAQLQSSISRVIRGKDEVIRLAIVALLSKGHLLIEDVPGVGKTTLAQALANSFHCSFQRIQFTSDLLPSDVVGTSIFNQIEQRFDFKPGPIFANIVLADEINRTTPKTQSALLEAMNEAQVTVDNHTHKLPRPFMVLATQNPIEHHGTYPLPESQLDRFLLRTGMGYLSRESEKEIMRQHTGGRHAAAGGSAVMGAPHGEIMQRAVELVRVDDSLRDYAIDIVERTRN